MADMPSAGHPRTARQAQQHQQSSQYRPHPQAQAQDTEHVVSTSLLLHNLHQTSPIGTSPAASPLSAHRQLDPESTARYRGGGHTTATTAAEATAGASRAGSLPIRLEDRSYRLQNPPSVDSGYLPHPSSSIPVEQGPNMAQFSSSYTSTSNRIRDSTGRLASMAPHDGDDRDDGNAGVGQDTRQQQQRQRPQGGVWVTHSSAGPSGHQLGSDLHFQTGKRNDSAMSTQDLLRTSPRAQPHQGPSFRNPAQAAAAKLPQPQLPAEEQASIQGRARMQASLGGAPDAAHALPNAASNINAMLTESRGIAASSIAPNPSWDTFVFPMGMSSAVWDVGPAWAYGKSDKVPPRSGCHLHTVVMRSPSSSAPPTYSSRLHAKLPCVGL